MASWRIQATDTGTTAVKTRDIIRGFVSGDPRTIVREIRGLPSGVTLREVHFLVKASKTTPDGAALFAKRITLAATPGVGAITNNGSASGAATVSIELTSDNTAKLTKAAVYSARAVLSDGSVYTVQEDTIQGTAAVSTGVVVPVARVVVNPALAAMRPNSILQLAARAFATDGTELFGRAVSWSISDSRFARIDQDGLVTAFDLPVLPESPGSPPIPVDLSAVATIDDQSDAAEIRIAPETGVPGGGQGGPAIGTIILARVKAAGSPV